MKLPDFHYTVLEPCDEHSFDKESILRFVFDIGEREWFERSFVDCKTKEDVADVLIALGNEIKNA